MDTQATLTQLRTTVDNNDFDGFRGQYRGFLSQYYAFQESIADTPTKVPSMSAIFGGNYFYLKETTNEQAQSLLKNARSASEVFGALPLETRLDFIKAFQEKINARAEEIMITITADTGKPIDLSREEMGKGKSWSTFAAEKAGEQIGPKISITKTGEQEVQLVQPRGAAQIIGAYNYPYALAVGGIVGALTAGNGVIVSAPLKAPNWVFPFMQAAREMLEEFGADAIGKGKLSSDDVAKLSKGLIQYSVGVNRDLTSQTDLVHFVGSDVTGKLIDQSRGDKKTILEMGGSNVVVVMQSAIDTVNTAEGIAKTIYNGFGPATGQRCTAPRILCVEKGAESVVQELAKICDNPQHGIGNPFVSGIKMGPLVDAGAHQKMEQAITLATDLAKAQGVDPKDVVHGTLRVSDSVIPQAKNENSFWVGPIMIDWGKIDMKNSEIRDRVTSILRDEIFGPLLHVVPPVNNLDEAIAVTKKLDSHGLAGAIFTANAQDADRYQSKIDITSLSLNSAPKDRSPDGPHGHPGRDVIGGSTHFKQYGKAFIRVGNVPQLAAG